jgi:hypothetical protein
MTSYSFRLATLDDRPEIRRLQTQFINDLADPLGADEGSHERSAFILVETPHERGKRAVGTISLMRASSKPFVFEQVFPDVWEHVDLRAVLGRSEIGRDHLAEVTRGLLEVRFVVRRTPRGAFTLTGEELSLDANRPLLGKPTPCVGRDMELGTLEATLSGCIEEGEPRAVLVMAPPGMGKSRLRHEFLRRVEARKADLLVLFGRGDPMSAGGSASLLGQALRRRCGILDSESLDAQRKKLMSRISERVPQAERERVASFIGELCGVPLPDADNMKLRAARRPRSPFHDIRAGFSASLARGPGIILDDLCVPLELARDARDDPSIESGRVRVLTHHDSGPIAVAMDVVMTDPLLRGRCLLIEHDLSVKAMIHMISHVDRDQGGMDGADAPGPAHPLGGLLAKVEQGVLSQRRLDLAERVEPARERVPAVDGEPLDAVLRDDLPEERSVASGDVHERDHGLPSALDVGIESHRLRHRRLAPSGRSAQHTRANTSLSRKEARAGERTGRALLIPLISLIRMPRQVEAP